MAARLSEDEEYSALLDDPNVASEMDNAFDVLLWDSDSPTVIERCRDAKEE